MPDTSLEFDSIISKCRDIFINKMKDYGSSWRIMRSSSLTDQLYIKSKRIRSIQEKGMAKVDEGITGEFYAIVNYAVMAIIQLKLGCSEEAKMEEEKAEKLYDDTTQKAKDLMENKNHDYGEAWREMRISSMTDLILSKLLRIKQIEGNDGKTKVSEGVEANYYDILNYAVFALIRLSEDNVKT